VEEEAAKAKEAREESTLRYQTRALAQARGRKSQRQREKIIEKDGYGDTRERIKLKKKMTVKQPDNTPERTAEESESSTTDSSPKEDNPATHMEMSWQNKEKTTVNEMEVNPETYHQNGHEKEDIPQQSESPDMVDMYIPQPEHNTDLSATPEVEEAHMTKARPLSPLQQPTSEGKTLVRAVLTGISELINDISARDGDCSNNISIQGFQIQLEALVRLLAPSAYMDNEALATNEVAFIVLYGSKIARIHTTGKPSTLHITKSQREHYKKAMTLRRRDTPLDATDSSQDNLENQMYFRAASLEEMEQTLKTPSGSLKHRNKEDQNVIGSNAASVWGVAADVLHAMTREEFSKLPKKYEIATTAELIVGYSREAGILRLNDWGEQSLRNEAAYYINKLGVSSEPLSMEDWNRIIQNTQFAARAATRQRQGAMLIATETEPSSEDLPISLEGHLKLGPPCIALSSAGHHEGDRENDQAIASVMGGQTQHDDTFQQIVQVYGLPEDLLMHPDEIENLQQLWNICNQLAHDKNITLMDGGVWLSTLTAEAAGYPDRFITMEQIIKNPPLAADTKTSMASQQYTWYLSLAKWTLNLQNATNRIGIARDRIHAAEAALRQTAASFPASPSPAPNKVDVIPYIAVVNAMSPPKVEALAQGTVYARITKINQTFGEVAKQNHLVNHKGTLEFNRNSVTTRLTELLPDRLTAGGQATTYIRDLLNEVTRTKHLHKLSEESTPHSAASETAITTALTIRDLENIQSTSHSQSPQTRTRTHPLKMEILQAIREMLLDSALYEALLNDHVAQAEQPPSVAEIKAASVSLAVKAIDSHGDMGHNLLQTTSDLGEMVAKGGQHWQIKEDRCSPEEIDLVKVLCEDRTNLTYIMDVARKQPTHRTRAILLRLVRTQLETSVSFGEIVLLDREDAETVTSIRDLLVPAVTKMEAMNGLPPVVKAETNASPAFTPKPEPAPIATATADHPFLSPVQHAQSGSQSWRRPDPQEPGRQETHVKEEQQQIQETHGKEEQQQIISQMCQQQYNQLQHQQHQFQQQLQQNQLQQQEQLHIQSQQQQERLNSALTSMTQVMTQLIARSEHKPNEQERYEPPRGPQYLAHLERQTSYPRPQQPSPPHHYAATFEGIGRYGEAQSQPMEVFNQEPPPLLLPSGPFHTTHSRQPGAAPGYAFAARPGEHSRPRQASPGGDSKESAGTDTSYRMDGHGYTPKTGYRGQETFGACCKYVGLTSQEHEACLTEVGGVNHTQLGIELKDNSGILAYLRACIRGLNDAVKMYNSKIPAMLALLIKHLHSMAKAQAVHHASLQHSHKVAIKQSVAQMCRAFNLNPATWSWTDSNREIPESVCQHSSQDRLIHALDCVLLSDRPTYSLGAGWEGRFQKMVIFPDRDHEPREKMSGLQNIAMDFIEKADDPDSLENCASIRRHLCDLITNEFRGTLTKMEQAADNHDEAAAEKLRKFQQVTSTRGNTVSAVETITQIFVAAAPIVNRDCEWTRPDVFSMIGREGSGDRRRRVRGGAEEADGDVEEETTSAETFVEHLIHNIMTTPADVPETCSLCHLKKHDAATCRQDISEEKGNEIPHALRGIRNSAGASHLACSTGVDDISVTGMTNQEMSGLIPGLEGRQNLIITTTQVDKWSQDIKQGVVKRIPRCGNDRCIFKTHNHTTERFAGTQWRAARSRGDGQACEVHLNINDQMFRIGTLTQQRRLGSRLIQGGNDTSVSNSSLIAMVNNNPQWSQRISSEECYLMQQSHHHDLLEAMTSFPEQPGSEMGQAEISQ